MSLLIKARRDGREIVNVTPRSAGWKYVGFAAYRLNILIEDLIDGWQLGWRFRIGRRFLLAFLGIGSDRHEQAEKDDR